MKKEVVCTHCYKVFYKYPYKVLERNFCSRSCLIKYRWKTGNMGIVKKGKYLNCMSCGKQIYLQQSDIKLEGNCCSKSCAVKIRWQNHNKKDQWVKGGSWTDYFIKSHIIHCDECGNNYLEIDKYDGECYLCINKIRRFSYNYINDNS